MNRMQPQSQKHLVTLFSTSSSGFDQKSEGGGEDDRWRIKTEEQWKKTDNEEEEESQPLISLGLGIGGSSSYCREKDRNVMVKKEEEEDEDDDDDQVVERERCRKYSVVRFTEEQVEELKRQLLILKYMVWGLPVPFQLLLPIWTTFKSSPFPPLLRAYFRGGLEHRQMMDPEPGRCRRTDGKKWRCHQSVIPNEKYCEKHMHRGSKRSRKLVETSPYTRTHNLINRNGIKPKFPENLGLKGPTKSVVGAPGLTTCTAMSNENDKQDNNPSNDVRPKFSENLYQNGPTGVVMRAPGLTTCTAKSNENDKLNNEAKHDIVANERIAVINQASGLDFSPKSVLQNDTGMRSPRVESCKNPESESRCRRTDGKKWRCKKEVLPYQKYCAQHVNRGKVRSKKWSLGSSASREALAAYGSTSSAKFSGTEQAKIGLGLDTNLKISLPTRMADPRTIIRDSVARNDASSSSTEATETDESTDVSDIIVLSP